MASRSKSRHPAKVGLGATRSCQILTPEDAALAAENKVDESVKNGPLIFCPRPTHGPRPTWPRPKYWDSSAGPKGPFQKSL